MNANLPAFGFPAPVAEFCQTVMFTLLHFFWQGLLVALVAAMWAVCTRRFAPQARYLGHLTLLAALAACPVMTFAWLHNKQGFAPTAAQRTPSSTVNALEEPTIAGAAQAPLDAGSTTALPGPVASTAPSALPGTLASDARLVPQPALWYAWAVRYSPIAVSCYLAGVVVMLLRLAAALWGGSQLRRSAVPVEDGAILRAVSRLAHSMGMKAAPAVAWCQLTAVPIVVGIFRPMILLPASIASSLPPAQLESVLAHELSHVLRHDLWVNLFQRFVESILFFHPAVWYVSRLVTVEREESCDDLVLASGVDRLPYADALVTLAELCQRQGIVSATALAVTGHGTSPFKRRVFRILMQEPAYRLSSSAVLAMVGLPVLLVLLSPLAITLMDKPAQAGDESASSIVTEPSSDGTSNESAALPPQTPPAPGQSPPPPAPAEDALTDIPWGEAASGIRMRAYPVAADMTEDELDRPRLAASFESDANVTLVVEIQNVSDQPIKVMDPRYGPGYPTAKGQSHTAGFGPHLYSFSVADAQGQPVNQVRPTGMPIDSSLRLSGVAVHTLQPQETRRVLLKVGEWGPTSRLTLNAGEYQITATVHGLNEATRAFIAKHWPDNEVIAAWSGTASSPKSVIRIQNNPAIDPKSLVWGPTVSGLRAAFVLLPSNKRHDYGSRSNLQFVVQNVSEEVVHFSSEDWRQGDKATVWNDKDEAKELSAPWYSGVTPISSYDLKPGEMAVIAAPDFGFAENQEQADGLGHPVGNVLVGPAGRYRLQYVLRFNNVQVGEGEDRTIPRKEDFTGELETGAVTLYVAQEPPADPAAAPGAGPAVQKMPMVKVDSVTGISREVFPDVILRLKQGHSTALPSADPKVPDVDAETKVDMHWASGIAFSFIPERAVNALGAGAVPFGEVDFGTDGNSETNVTVDLRLDSPKDKALGELSVRMEQTKQPIWVPGHLGLYEMNRGGHRKFKLVRIHEVDLGVGPKFGPVIALVLPDTESAFGVVGRDWMQAPRGPNGEGIITGPDGTVYYGKLQ